MALFSSMLNTSAPERFFQNQMSSIQDEAGYGKHERIIPAGNSSFVSSNQQATRVPQMLGRAHGMRNELSFSSKVALDGSSWRVCCLDEEAYPRVLQASENVIKGVL